MHLMILNLKNGNKIFVVTSMSTLAYVAFKADVISFFNSASAPHPPINMKSACILLQFRLNCINWRLKVLHVIW